MRVLNSVLRRCGAFPTWPLGLTIFLGVPVSAASDTLIELPAREQASAPHPACAAGVIPFMRIPDRPHGLRLSGRRIVLRNVYALHVTQPELFRFQRFEAGRMRGVLSDGCPFEFWWSGEPASSYSGEVRILSTVEPLDRRYAFLQLTPDPAPGWTPTIEGYRHVMSSAIFPGPSYIGLWNRTDGAAGSLVATYDPAGSRVSTLGTANWTYDGIYHAFAIHQFYFTLVDVPERTEPLYIATFEQLLAPGIRCRRARRR